MNVFRAWWLVPVGICTVLGLFFFVPWVKGQVYGTFDLANITIAIEDLYARYQHHGQIPVWTPEFQGGFPMMANGFQSFWYVPHLLLRSVLPGVWVANISLLLHLWLAAAGMVVLLRHTKLPWAATFVGALIFAGGGYFVGHITLPHLFFPAAWLPLMLWAQLRWMQTLHVRDAVVLAGIVAALVFSGHIQLFLYAALLLAVTGVVMLVRQRQRLTTLWWQAILIPLIVFLLTAVHALPLRELIPLSKRSIPVTNEEAYDVSYPLWQTLTWVKADIFGHQESYVGAKNEPELLLFFGVAGVLLGLLGLSSRRWWQSDIGIIVLITSAVALLLAGGGYLAFYRWLHSLPTFLSGLANPGRAMVLVHLGWSIAAAYGVAVLQAAPRAERLRRIVIALGVLLVVTSGLVARVPDEIQSVLSLSWLQVGMMVGAVGIIVLIVSLLRRTAFSFALVSIVAVELITAGLAVNPTVLPQTLHAAPHVSGIVPVRADAPRVYSHTRFVPTPQADFSPTVGPVVDSRRLLEQTTVAQQSTIQAIQWRVTWDGKPIQDTPIRLQILTAAGEILGESSREGHELSETESISFPFDNLTVPTDQPLTLRLNAPSVERDGPHSGIFVATHADYNPTGSLRSCVRTTCQPLVVDGASTDADVVITYTGEPYNLDRELLVPLFGEGLGYHMVRGHMQLQLLAWHHYLFALGERGDLVASEVAAHRTLLDRLSVGTVLTSWPFHRQLTGLDNLPLIERVLLHDREIHVYRNDDAWPRVSLATSVVHAASSDAALQLLIDNAVPPDAVVVSDSGFETPPPGSGGSVEVTRDEPTLLSARVSSDRPELFVVRDTLYPGWQVTVDETPVQPVLVDSLFIGVSVPAGAHTVTLQYDSRWQRTGSWLSLLGWILFIGYAGFTCRSVILGYARTRPH